MNKRKRIGYILLVVGVLFAAPMFWALVSFVFTLSTPNKSIGIIGGADGPTAVFILSMFLGYNFIWGIIQLFVGIVCIVLSVIFLKENKKE